MDKVYDVTIIGAGPAGLFTAFYCGMRQASVKIIESLPHTGGQLSALYPEKYIYDVAGFPKIQAQKLVDQLETQAGEFHPEIVLNQAVETVERMEDDIFKLTSNNGDTHLTKTIIITAGNGAFQPRRLNIGESEDFEDINLDYYVKNLSQYEGKHVAVLGGGDSAVDWALTLETVASKVSIIHRRNKFRAHESSVKALHDSTVDTLTPYKPASIVADERIEKLLLQETDSEEIVELDIDYLVVNYGFIASLGPIKNWGLEIEKNSILVNSKMETNIPGIYAAGDVCTYEGKVNLIVTGFGEGPTAVNNAMNYIDPTSKIQPRHSTSMF